MGSYLGQNFLIDSKIRHNIADHITKLYTHCGCTALIEIGPGKGAITKLIHHLSPHFFVIEKDLLMRSHLEALGLEEQRSLFFGDVLEFDIHQLLLSKGLTPEKTLIVGNLPYYITSPIFRKFFGYGKQEFAGGVFMIQKEVAEKICTLAEKKSYLWWLVNYAYQVHFLKTVPGKAFSPAPKVTSAVVGFSATTEFPRNITFETCLRFLDDFSPFSRKTLGAIAKMVAKKMKKGKKANHNAENNSQERKIPDALSGKRLEVCSWEEIGRCLLEN